jgi:hypothetical protein
MSNGKPPPWALTPHLPDDHDLVSASRMSWTHQ